MVRTKNKKRITRHKRLLCSEEALGYVEALIAIAISGLLMVAVILLASRVLKSTVRNELQDEATQQVIMYLDVSRAIKDNGWGTDDNVFPELSNYDFCYDESRLYYFCDPSVDDSALFTVSDDTFRRTVVVNKDSSANLVSIEVTLECNPGKCKNINYTDSVVLSLSSVD